MTDVDSMMAKEISEPKIETSKSMNKLPQERSSHHFVPDEMSINSNKMSFHNLPAGDDDGANDIIMVAE